jgi:outer membrane biosynthesis protein TonB
MTRRPLFLALALLGACAAPAAFAQDTTQSTLPPSQQQTPPTPPMPPTPPVPPTPPDTPPPPPMPPSPSEVPPAPVPPESPPPAPPAPPAPEAPPAPDAPPPPPAPAAPPSDSTTLPQSSSAAGAPVTVNQKPADSISSNYRIDFGAMDRNGDGHISRGEVRASGNEDLVREFHVVDRNSNGRLTREELKGWLD